MGLADAIASGDSPTLKRRSKPKPAPAPVTPDQALVRAKSSKSSAPAPVAASATGTQSSRTRSGRSSAHASPKRSRSRPEPALTFEPPKRVEDVVQKQLAKLQTRRADKAAKKPVYVAPKLEGKAKVKVTPKRTLVAPSVARRAAQELPKPQAKQAAQRLRAAKKPAGQRAPKPPKARQAVHRKPEDPKIEGRKEKAVAKRLAKAAKKSQGGIAKEIDRGYGPDETIKPRYAAIVAESEGLPGKTYRQIAKGESAFRPGVPNPDDGYPSLFQATPSVQSAETRAKWDAIAASRKGGSTNPIVAAKQIKVLAGEGTGVSNFYGTSFVTDENAHLPGGPAAARRKLYGKPKPIPPKLKEKAKEVLGPQKAKEVVKKAKSSGTTEVKQKPGKYAGSQRAVIELLPKGVRVEARGDKRTPSENAAVGGAADSDHLTTNKAAYGGDIPPDPKVYAKLRKELGLPPASTGEDTVVKDGYRYQLIFGSQYGHGDHIHLGAEWVGAGAAPTVSSSGGGSIGGTVLTTSAGAATSPAARRKVSKRQSHKRKVRKQLGRERSRNLRKLIAQGVPAELNPEDYTVKPSVESYADYVKKAGVSVGL